MIRSIYRSNRSVPGGVDGFSAGAGAGEAGVILMGDEVGGVAGEAGVFKLFRSIPEAAFSIFFGR